MRDVKAMGFFPANQRSCGVTMAMAMAIINGFAMLEHIS